MSAAELDAAIQAIERMPGLAPETQLLLALARTVKDLSEAIDATAEHVKKLRVEFEHHKSMGDHYGDW